MRQHIIRPYPLVIIIEGRIGFNQWSVGRTGIQLKQAGRGHFQAQIQGSNYSFVLFRFRFANIYNLYGSMVSFRLDRHLLRTFRCHRFQQGAIHLITASHFIDRGRQGNMSFDDRVIGFRFAVIVRMPVQFVTLLGTEAF